MTTMRRAFASSIIAAAGGAGAIDAVGGILCNTRDGDVLVNEIVRSRDATIFQKFLKSKEPR